MASKPISPHLKNIVDDLVEKHGIEWCIARGHKLNEMNKQLLEGHKADGEKAEATKVARDISVNEKATEYLKELLKQTQDDK
jgi:hypothetical protein